MDPPRDWLNDIMTSLKAEEEAKRERIQAQKQKHREEQRMKVSFYEGYGGCFMHVYAMWRVFVLMVLVFPRKNSAIMTVAYI